MMTMKREIQHGIQMSQYLVVTVSKLFHMMNVTQKNTNKSTCLKLLLNLGPMRFCSHLNLIQDFLVSIMMVVDSVLISVILVIG